MRQAGRPVIRAGRFRQGDGLLYKLTRDSQRGDRVYFDPGPGVRLSGELKDWEADGMAVIEVDADDRAAKHRKLKGSLKIDLPQIANIMRIPVR